MRRADRLFRIVQLLRHGRLLTAARLAEKLSVSTRTIYRDVMDLQLSGAPIEGEPGVGYTLRRDFDLPPLMFTSSELTALVLGARLVQAWGEPKASPRPAPRCSVSKPSCPQSCATASTPSRCMPPAS
jgi:predicted DNA-binding transcriptional regulator YafY